VDGWGIGRSLGSYFPEQIKESRKLCEFTTQGPAVKAFRIAYKCGELFREET